MKRGRVGEKADEEAHLNEVTQRHYHYLVSFV
jgi:hypothetical protein